MQIVPFFSSTLCSYPLWQTTQRLFKVHATLNQRILFHTPSINCPLYSSFPNVCGTNLCNSLFIYFFVKKVKAMFTDSTDKCKIWFNLVCCFKYIILPENLRSVTKKKLFPKTLLYIINQFVDILKIKASNFLSR